MFRLKFSVLFLFISAQTVLAQAPNPGYYKPNYADSTVDKKGPAPKDWSLRGSTADQNTKSQASVEPAPTPALATDLAPLTEKRDSKDPYAGLVISAVGVLLNAENDSHREEILAQLVRFSASSRIKLGTVYSLGGMVATMHSPSRKTLIKHGARIRFLAKPPKELAFIKSSPTWILSTEKGDLIIEAPVKLADLAAPDGTFMPPLEQSAVLVREMVAKSSPTLSPASEPK
jgi:hypothetical protein